MACQSKLLINTLLRILSNFAIKKFKYEYKMINFRVRRMEKVVLVRCISCSLMSNFDHVGFKMQKIKDEKELTNLLQGKQIITYIRDQSITKYLQSLVGEMAPASDQEYKYDPQDIVIMVSPSRKAKNPNETVNIEKFSDIVAFLVTSEGESKANEGEVTKLTI